MEIVTGSLFLSLVLFLLWVLYQCFRSSTKSVSLIFSVVLGWLLFTGILAKIGFFSNFTAMPPRILLVILPVAIALGYASFSKKLLPLINDISQARLIQVHSFRIVMEVVLWLLAKQSIAPELLTWNGHNFDILVGLSALLIAYFCYTKETWPKMIALVWSFLGIALLINVFVHGFLSAPLPFQVFFTTPPNTFVGTFPYIWLPGFVVPCALLFHIMFIRKFMTTKRLIH